MRKIHQVIVQLEETRKLQKLSYRGVSAKAGMYPDWYKKGKHTAFYKLAKVADTLGYEIILTPKQCEPEYWSG